MNSSRNDPESEQNQSLTRDNERAVFAAQMEAKADDEEMRARIATICGRPIFRFCGDYDSDHDLFFDPDATKHLPEHLRYVDTLVRCRKCDGHRWASTRCWEQSSEADDYPDYLNSRDAMAEAVATLTDEQYRQFGYELARVCGCRDTQTWMEARKIMEATPKQRAVAFLRTVG